MSKSSSKKAHVGLYGHVGMVRGFCRSCDSFAFVIDGRVRCCGEKFVDEPNHFRRMTQVPDVRRWVPVEVRRRKLEEQEGRCFYCFQRLKSRVSVGGYRVFLRLEWDHMVPFSFDRNDDEANLAAVCHKCNNWKSNLVFNSIEEIRIYVEEKWQALMDGRRKMRGVREVLREAPAGASVLQSQMQESPLDEATSESVA